MRKLYWPGILLLGALLLSGCSERQFYEAMRNSQRVECSKLPAKQYEDCLEQHDETYDSYKRARDEAVEQQG